MNWRLTLFQCSDLNTVFLFEDLLKCQERRLEHLNKMCQEHQLQARNLSQLTLPEIHSIVKHHLVDDRHKFTLKAIPKTGCSSWKTILVENSVPRITKQPAKINPHAWNWITNSYDLKLLNEEQSRPILVNKLQNYFNMLTVRHPFDRLESGFREKYLKQHPELDQNNKEAVAAAFQMFLERRLREKNMDKHWKPISQHTAPCTIPFRFVT